MHITKDTRVSDIFAEYGDIVEVMELFGIQRVKNNFLRMILARRLTVEWAARFHRVPLDEFLEILHKAVETDRKPAGVIPRQVHSTPRPVLMVEG